MTTIFDEREDNELGVTRLVSSRGGVAALGDAGRGPEVKLLGVQGDSSKGRGVTVCVSAVPTAHQLGAQGFEAAILTGIIRFGNGAGLCELQFDIPNAQTHDPTFPSQGGLMFSVPAGNFELYARDDSLMIPNSTSVHPSSVGGSMVSAFIVRDRVASVSPSIFRKTTFFAFARFIAGQNHLSNDVGLKPYVWSPKHALPSFASSYVVLRYPRYVTRVQFGRAGSKVIEELLIPTHRTLAQRLVPTRATWVRFQCEEQPAPNSYVAHHSIKVGQIIYNMDAGTGSYNTSDGGGVGGPGIVQPAPAD